MMLENEDDLLNENTEIENSLSLIRIKTEQNLDSSIKQLSQWVARHVPLPKMN